MNAVGIVRVSRKGDREGESFRSPDEQRERIEELCDGRDWKLVETYQEIDVSGGAALEKRPGLSKAVEAVESGRAGVVVVAYFDRLVRSLKVQAEVAERVEAAGGKLLAADVGEVSNGTAAQWLSATMLGMVSEYQRRTTAERAAGAQTRALESGIPPFRLVAGLRRQVLAVNGGKPVLGDIELDPEWAPVVADAVRLRADGAPWIQVRDFLREKGLHRSMRGAITLVQSKQLVGDIVFGEQRGRLPVQVVDRPTWERAQRVRGTPGRKTKSDRLLARLGVLHCASCGGRMIAGRVRGSYPIYRCQPNGDCTRRVTISAEIAEEVVVKATRKAFEGIIGVKTLDGNEHAARTKLATAQHELDAFVDVFSGAMDREKARDRLAQLQEAVRAAQDDVDRLDVGSARRQEILELDTQFDELSVEDQRRAIQLVVKRASVRPAASKGDDPASRIEIEMWHPSPFSPGVS